MKKKILIFECWHRSPQFETGLEIAELHAIEGDEVTYVNIGGKLPFLEWHGIGKNAMWKAIYRQHFNYKIRNAREVVNPSVKILKEDRLSPADKQAESVSYSFKDIEELKRFEWQGIEIGMAAASSLISVTSDLQPDTVKYKDLINSIIHSSIIVGITFEDYLDRIQPDLVYFRNGRVAVYRPILRLCQKKNISFRVHDRGCNKFHYSLGKNIRHNFEMINEQIHDAWNEADPIEKYKIAEQYFNERRQGKELSWKSFVKGQTIGILPDGWDDTKYNIVFFTSSMAEYAAVSGDINLNILFDNQPIAVVEIAEYLSKFPDIHFYVRLHPNLLNQSENEQRIWHDMQHPNIRFIQPSSDVSTYTLIDESDLIMSYRSMVSIEASFSQKPSIILSRAWYEKLNAVYIPGSKNELFEMLSSKSLQSKPIEGSQMFGHYMKTFGVAHKLYSPINFYSGTFKGVNLQGETIILKLIRKNLDKIKKIKAIKNKLFTVK